MKWLPPSLACYVASAGLFGFAVYREYATVGDVSKTSMFMFVLAAVLIIIPQAKRFSLNKVFEFERHDDN